MLTSLDLRGQLEPASGVDRAAQLRSNLPRPSRSEPVPLDEVRRILEAVRVTGDLALRESDEQHHLSHAETIRIPPQALAQALRDAPPLLREALEEAHESILAFHRSTKPAGGRFERDGIMVREMWRPVERVGCYVAGGSGQSPSSLLMSAVPARVAGVNEVIACVAPGIDGGISPAVLAAAELSHVDEVYCLGGAPAIGAMAYGTESLRAVDTIVGSGDDYVTAAKSEVAGLVGLPSHLEGPSEVVIVADETTPPEYAAIDLIAHAEDGCDGLWVITWSEEAAEHIANAVSTIATRSPRRELVEKALAGGGYLVLVDDAVAAMEVANAVAPEHLQLMTIDPETLVPLMRHAGVTLVGTHAPASVANHLAGPSSLLPVRRSARFSSGLGVHDFLRRQHVVSLDEATLARVAPHVVALAEVEGLDAEARSVRMRARP